MPNFTPACRLVTDFTHGEMCKKTFRNLQKKTNKKKTGIHTLTIAANIPKGETRQCGVRRKTKQQMAGVLTVTHSAQVDEEAFRLALKNSRTDLVSGKCGSLMAVVIHIKIKGTNPKRHIRNVT